MALHAGASIPAYPQYVNPERLGISQSREISGQFDRPSAPSGAASLCSEISIEKGVVPTTPGHSSPLPLRKELCGYPIR